MLSSAVGSPSRAVRDLARRPDPPMEAPHQTMAKRSRGSTSRPGQRPPLQRQAARPAGDAAGGRRARRRAATRHPDRRRRGARRRARGRDRRRGEGRRGGQEDGRRPSRSVDAPGPRRRRASTISAAEEYAYVARDVRRIAIVGGGADPDPAGLWVVVAPHRDQRPLGSTDRRRAADRATIGTMPSARRPTGARPEALFQPPPERQPLAARMRPRNLDGVRRPGAPRRRARPAPARASPAATSRRSCCGVRPGPARPASPACSRPRSAPISRRCRRSCRASSRSAPRSPRPRSGSNLHGTRSDPLPRRDPSLQQGPAGRAPAARRGRHGHAHRRDDREPLLRGQLGAPVADARLAARGTDRRRGRGRRPPGADRRGARAGRLARAGRRRRPHRRRLRAPRLARRRRRARGAQRPRGRDRARRVRGHPRRRRAASARDSRTSRPPPSSASSPTTAPATATTTRSRRSSRACAATTRTPRSTGWRR